jgi:hypothetical protein
MRAKFNVGGVAYEVDVTAQLATLTGTESITVEEYLGGFDKFRASGTTTRSVIVMLWLARRQAGETVTLDEVADTRGLVFGDVIEEFDEEDAAEDLGVDPGLTPQQQSETLGEPPTTPDVSPVSSANGASEDSAVTSETIGSPS